MYKSLLGKLAQKIIRGGRRLVLLIQKPKSGSFEEHKINVNTKFLEGIILNRLLKIDDTSWKTSKNVEKKYDGLVGLNTKKITGNDKRWYFNNDQYTQFTFRELHELQMREVIRAAEKYKCGSILEVGGGQLLNIEILIDACPTTELSAIDLSFNRILAGRNYIREKLGKDVKVAKANAISLPFPDNHFDLVFSRHALEHMPQDYQGAIDEMVRVSRKAVVLLEPSYELGNISQKLKMISSDYVRGIKRYFDSKAMDLEEYHLLPIGPAFNRTALYVYLKTINASNENVPFTMDFCPKCKVKMIKHSDGLYCQQCEAHYFVFEGIPVLDTKCSIGISQQYTAT